LDSKPTKSVGNFEESKFFVGGHQILLEWCPKLIKVGQNAVNKSQLKNKNEQYCAVRLFIFKVAETFCTFSVRDCCYFLPCWYPLVALMLAYDQEICFKTYSSEKFLSKK
jgi:hypothetical protein